MFQPKIFSSTHAWIAIICFLSVDRLCAMPSPGRIGAIQPTIAPAQTNSASPWLKGKGIAEWLEQQVIARKAAAAAAQPRAKSRERQAEVQGLKESVGSAAKVTFRQNGTPIEVKAPMLEHAMIGPMVSGADRRESTARNFLRAQRKLLLLVDPDTELELRKTESDHLQRDHLRFRQRYSGLPVWPAEVIVHLDPAGNVDLLDGAFVPTPSGLGTEPRINPEQAVENAKAKLLAGAAGRNTQPELIIYGPLDHPARLAWKFNLSGNIAQAWNCVVDAMDGSLAAAFTLVSEGAVPGSGLDGLGKTRTLNVWQQGATFYMVDTSKRMYDATSTPPDSQKTKGAIFIWDSQNTPPTNNPSATDNFLGNPVQATSSAATSGWNKDAVGAAYGLSQTYDYYYEKHGRNSLDGAGGSISGFVRVGINWRNAFWTQDYKIMVFGDTLPNGLDVCAHELTHGVIFGTGDGGILNYHDQPGALNESLADIFGENVEARTEGTNDWLMGEDTVLGALRDMANPGRLNFGGNPYPSKMSEYYQLGPEQDHGGVHENSSIPNHCYYLLAGGLDGAVGIPVAEKIFYRAMTLHLAKESQFIDFRHACISSAEELYGTNSVAAQKTAEAFDAVEIIDAPTTPDPTPVPVVNAADSTLFLRWNPFAGFSGAYELYRREAAKGDLVGGTFVPTVHNLAAERVSVSGDGSYAFFVTEDHDYGAVNTDGSSPMLGGEPGVVHSLAMTPDGSRFAFVPLDSTGQPMNMIGILDLKAQTSKLIKLYGLDSEGNKSDIINYADVLDFTSDGQKLVYDAYSEFRTANGSIFAGWTIYAMELATTNITALISLNGNYDFGNPCLGKSRNNLVTFEVVDKQTGLASVVASDLFSGDGNTVAQLNVANDLANPDYTGDERAIIYSTPDFLEASAYSLVQQPMAADGITPNGPATAWLLDADRATIYRRGVFVASNSLPTITLTSPSNGQNFPPSASILIQANANDVDGTVAKVEFYEGSDKLGEATAQPYSFTWNGAPVGTFDLIARAIDNLGGAQDSTPVRVTVGGGGGNRPSLVNARIVGGKLQFTLQGDTGKVYSIQQSTDFGGWSTLGTVTNATGSSTFQDPNGINLARRFYRAVLQ